MRAYDNVEMIDVCKELKLPEVHKELSALKVIDIEK